MNDINEKYKCLLKAEVPPVKIGNTNKAGKQMENKMGEMKNDWRCKARKEGNGMFKLTDDMKLMILTESVKQPEHAVVKYLRHIGDIQGELVDFRQIGDQCDATLLVGSEKLFIQNVKLSEIEIISSPDIHKAPHLLETTMCGYNRRTYMAAMGATLTEEEKQIVAESEKYIKQYEAEENKRLLKSAREDFEQLRDIPNMPEEAIDILREWTLRDDDDEMDYDND